MAWLVSIAFWGFVLVTSMLLFPVASLIRATSHPFDKRLVVLHRFTSFWASLYSWCSPFWKLRIEGEENLPHEGAFVIVSNHQSLVDIFVLFRLSIHYKWVSKKENFRIPFIGWNMSLNRYISIDRGSVKGHLRMMRDCERALLDGNSIMIFPEGTRSIDGNIRPFKDGAFELALRTGKGILPIVIDGSSHALPKKGFILRGTHRITIKILPVIPFEDFSSGTAPSVRERVYSLIHAALVNLRRS